MAGLDQLPFERYLVALKLPSDELQLGGTWPGWISFPSKSCSWAVLGRAGSASSFRRAAAGRYLIALDQPPSDELQLGGTWSRGISFPLIRSSWEILGRAGSAFLRRAAAGRYLVALDPLPSDEMKLGDNWSCWISIPSTSCSWEVLGYAGSASVRSAAAARYLVGLNQFPSDEL